MDKLTAKEYALMIENGANCLCRNRKIVDDLNVFPVPDGDTGDNMFMTINSGVKNIKDTESDDLGESSASISKGMFMGARGNSGVILSRIFAGISKGFEGLKEASLQQVKDAFEIGIKESYGAVAKPVEGTMLTVFREAVEKAKEATSIDQFLEYFDKGLKQSLDNTPNLLPILKENGVVDSGGAGLVYISQGFMSAKDGEVLESEEKHDSNSKPCQSANLDLFGPDSVLDYGYCTEFLLRLQNSKVGKDFDEKVLFDWLYKNGDSVVAFRNDSIIKVHIHTKTPGEILNHCQLYGEFLTLKIENMTLQHHEATIQNNYQNEEKAQDNTDNISENGMQFHKNFQKHIATVTVAAGEGLVNLFNEIGVDYVVPGGQSMNPSVQDFIDAFNSVNAQNIIVMPNNSNVILTAKQACSMYDKANVVIIPTKTVGEGYGALTAMDVEGKTIEEVVEEMTEAVGETVTGFVAKANRSTVMDGVNVHDGDYLGFTDDNVLVDDGNRVDTAVRLADELGTNGYGVLLVMVGKEVLQSPDGKKEVEELKSLYEKKYKGTEVIFMDGVQPIYDYIMILQ